MVTANLTEIDTVAQLPDNQTRGAKSESERITLTQLADTNLANWQKLKRYIADAFSNAQQKPNLQAAGYQYYQKAANYNWDSLQGLLTAAQTYIAANIAVLSANDNMPPAFFANFTSNKTSFDTLHQQFLNSEENAQQQTEIKVVANNVIHSKLMSMFLDGQEIFKNDESTKKQFIFDQVLTIISGSGVAGLKGNVTIFETNTPIPNATITIVQNSKTTITNLHGHYQILQLAAQTYTIQITAPGYQDIIIENVLVKTGTISTLNVTLKPIT